MTLAELISTVEHAKQQLDKASVPYHKVPVTVLFKSGDYFLDLFPGALKVAQEHDKDVTLPPGTHYLEFEAE